MKFSCANSAQASCDDEDNVQIGLLGHAGPYFPYDPDDARAPAREKRPPGFVREDEYVRGGVVKTYRRRRKRV